MSIGSRKKDKDKDVKGASGAEASVSSNIGSVQGGAEGRSTTTTDKQEPASTTQNISTTQ